MRLAGGASAQMELNAANLLVRYQSRLFSDTVWKKPESVVWTNMVMPTELLYAAGCIPVHIELMSGWMSTLGLAAGQIAHAHAAGFPVGVCSYHKAVIGALESGMLPPPKTAVLSSHICDGGTAMARYLRERHGTEVFLLEVPYLNTPQNRRLMRKRLEKLCVFFLKRTGRSFGRAELEGAMRLSNEAREDLVRANCLREKRLLFWGNLALRNLFGLTFLLGSAEGARIARAYRKELEGREPMPGKYHRLLWVHFAPLFSGELLRYFEQTLKCAVAFDMTGYIYWEPLNERRPLSSLSRKVMSHFFLCQTDGRAALYSRIIREMNIEAAVIFMHQGCRAIPGAAWELKELCGRQGLPCLELSGDCIDPGGVSAQQLKLRMDAFSESLENRL